MAYTTLSTNQLFFHWGPPGPTWAHLEHPPKKFGGKNCQFHNSTHKGAKGSMPKKNPEKVGSFAKPGGGGVSKGKQKTEPQVCKCVFYSEHSESF